MNDFRRYDAKPGTPDGVTVEFSREVRPDSDFDSSYFADNGETQAYLDDGSLLAVSVHAVATVSVQANRTGTIYRIASAGCYGVLVESEADPYLNIVYAEELDTLKIDLRSIARHILAD